MTERNYNMHFREDGKGCPIRLWNKHVKIEEKAIEQLEQIALMPFVGPHIAAMPDCHWGMGATVGSVIPSKGAIMPAAVGVDIGCGMMAVRTNLKFRPRDIHDQRDPMEWFFEQISKAVPHGRTNDGGPGDRGAWHDVPEDIQQTWNERFSFSVTGRRMFVDRKEVPSQKLKPGGVLGCEEPTSMYVEEKDTVFTRHPGALSRNAERQLGTLGTGNHFIEVCTEIDNPNSNLWVVIHSGSRGFGNRIGTYFTKLAGELCAKWHIPLPNKDLGYFPEGTPEYDDYIDALVLAQEFAWTNREIMMGRVMKAIGAVLGGEETDSVPPVIHMHHNYMQKYMLQHGCGGEKVVNLTRKGAVDASFGKFVIIPGSMGAKTYIARGYGNLDSFESCSHGAGRAMSRTEAKRRFTVHDHELSTAGVMCHKGKEVLDETPLAYKDIDNVMASQSDLVEPVLKLRQLVCVKGLGE